MADGRYTGRKAVEVPTAGSGTVHAPERIGPAPGMMVTVAELMAPSDNDGTVIVGWFGATSVPGLEAGYEVQPGAIITLQSPIIGEDGVNTVRFDLYDLYLTAVNDGDAVMYFTW
jgi:hypothetical protein